MRTKTGVGYVWVLTNMELVYYIFTETREGTTVKKILEDFKGVIVTDFYSAYDSIGCSQQKCHIHLIRDINEDLLKNPFDEEFKVFTKAYTKLFNPIVVTIDKFGLSKYHLNKHKSHVERFYNKFVNKEYNSNNSKNYQRRFLKYKDKLFVFLEYDSIPWNNNNAEHMIKRIVKIRKNLAGLTNEKGIREYLILISICESLQLRNISFFIFFQSSEFLRLYRVASC